MKHNINKVKKALTLYLDVVLHGVDKNLVHILQEILVVSAVLRLVEFFLHICNNNREEIEVITKRASTSQTFANS